MNEKHKSLIYICLSTYSKKEKKRRKKDFKQSDVVDRDPGFT